MRTDWTITGVGLVTIINDEISNRCQLSYNTNMTWNGNNQLVNCEIIADVKVTDPRAAYSRAALVLRSDISILNCYLLLFDSPNIYYLCRIVNGVSTILFTFHSTFDYNVFRTIRFRIDGYQLSVHEYINGSWVQSILLVDNNQTLVSGKVGISNWGQSTNSLTVLFDNVNINQRT